MMLKILLTGQMKPKNEVQHKEILVLAEGVTWSHYKSAYCHITRVLSETLGHYNYNLNLISCIISVWYKDYNCGAKVLNYGEWVVPLRTSRMLGLILAFADMCPHLI